MTKKLGRKQLVLASLVLALGAAVYLNWQFAGTNKLPVGDEGNTSSQLGAAQLVNNAYVETVSDNLEEGPRLQVVQEVRHGLLLGGPAGQEGDGRALAVGLQCGDGEAGGLPHPGEDGDVPLRSADPGGHGLLPGDAALDAAQIQMEGMVHAAALDGSFQDRSALQGLLQGGEADGGRGAEALRRVQFIFRHDRSHPICRS